ncbi:PaaI family thioesterase [[Mycobacterium] nativiensis]|uniref:Acyl-coenzyme A thioesterase THEM4 n=1 Tax=[Mycobacterium] nativiensis TaxID=2855503 RepID=A0ABU5XTZ8_9MYCO|nr:PaaI family thioesterase [Mycolicibacter sp. MYC340]MEB3030981.1 PaaI family thioesterase [Mycolicibacter sp. MYC340]
MSSPHAGGGFNPPEPTEKGGPDYGRFLETMRALQDHARAVDAPHEVISRAADALQEVCDLLAPFDTDEWSSPSGRRLDLPMRGNLLPVPMKLQRQRSEGAADRLAGWARFRRFHLGRNGAAHGGAIALLFDSVLGTASWLLTGGPYQRTAYLHMNYRNIVPIDKELQIEAWVSRTEGRKIYVETRLCDGDTLLADAEALFVVLKPGQP